MSSKRHDEAGTECLPARRCHTEVLQRMQLGLGIAMCLQFQDWPTMKNVNSSSPAEHLHSIRAWKVTLKKVLEALDAKRIELLDIVLHLEKAGHPANRPPVPTLP